MEPVNKRDRFGVVALLLGIGCVCWVVSRYDICFQNSETVCRFEPRLVENGLRFSWQDLRTSLDVWASDGDSRPRVVSGLGDIVTTKSRLALWDYVLPHPSFTPLWALTVVLATVLLYKFLYVVTGDRQVALVGAAVYLVSPGLLSGMTMLFHSGKPLTNLIVIAALWLSAKINERVAGENATLLQSPWHCATLLALLFIGPFADETATFAFLVPLVWCPSLFWSRRLKLKARMANWTCILSPALAAAGAILWVLPALTMTALHREFNFLSYLQRLTEGTRLRFSYLLWTGYNLFAAETLPGAFNHVNVPVRWPRATDTRIDLPIVAVVVGIAAIAGVTWIMRRQKAWPAFRKLELLTGAFILFQAAVMLCHPFLLVAPGFYYGAIFSILFASIVALLYSSLRSQASAMARIAAIGTVLFVGGTSLFNFFPVNASWMKHENILGLGMMHLLPFYEQQGDWKLLKELRHPAFYSEDVARAPGVTPVGEIRHIWRRWQRGEPQLLDGAVRVREFWVLQELMLKNEHSLAHRPAGGAVR